MTKSAQPKNNPAADSPLEITEKEAERWGVFDDTFGISPSILSKRSKGPKGSKAS